MVMGIKSAKSRFLKKFSTRGAYGDTMTIHTSLAAFCTVALVVSTSLSGCVSKTPLRTAQDMFFDRLASYCGQAFAGRLVSNETPDADMVGMPMVMHVRTCSSQQIRVPFHVGKKDGEWDRSRTWVLTRNATGMRLKHDHRHDDGKSDTVTMYGGDTVDMGTADRQEFVLDAESKALFKREGLPKSVTNIWAVEVGPGGKFAYELRRTDENARFFRVEFDLTKPVELPPPPWGASLTVHQALGKRAASA